MPIVTGVYVYAYDSLDEPDTHIYAISRHQTPVLGDRFVYKSTECFCYSCGTSLYRGFGYTYIVDDDYSSPHVEYGCMGCDIRRDYLLVNYGLNNSHDYLLTILETMTNLEEIEEAITVWYNETTMELEVDLRHRTNGAPKPLLPRKLHHAWSFHRKL